MFNVDSYADLANLAYWYQP